MKNPLKIDPKKRSRNNAPGPGAVCRGSAGGNHKFNKIENNLTEEKQRIGLSAEEGGPRRMLTRLGRLRARSGSKLPSARFRSGPWDDGMPLEISLLLWARAAVPDFLLMGLPTEIHFLLENSHKISFRSNLEQKTGKMQGRSQKAAKSEKMTPEGAKGEPKVSQREPKGSQREPKGSQKGAKGSQRGPLGTQNDQKM